MQHVVEIVTAATTSPMAGNCGSSHGFFLKMAMRAELSAGLKFPAVGLHISYQAKQKYKSRFACIEYLSVFIFWG